MKDGSKTVATQVYLDKTQHVKLRKLAIEEGVTMSELVRRAVDSLLAAGKSK